MERNQDLFLGFFAFFFRFVFWASHSEIALSTTLLGCCFFSYFFFSGVWFCQSRLELLRLLSAMTRESVGVEVYVSAGNLAK